MLLGMIYISTDKNPILLRRLIQMVHGLCYPLLILVSILYRMFQKARRCHFNGRFFNQFGVNFSLAKILRTNFQILADKKKRFFMN